MCTVVGKIRGDTVLLLDGIGCCLAVEDVHEVAPDISQANGWQEFFVEQSFPGKSVTWVALGDDAVCRLQRERPAGMLEYRERTVHFRSRERITATRDYVAARDRRAADFPAHRGFLENLPAEFLKASARRRVVGLLDRILEHAEGAEPAAGGMFGRGR